MKLVVFGLTVSSSWGNGHATLWRGLCRALGRLGHQVVFFERDVPCHPAHRDLTELAGHSLRLYRNWDDIRDEAERELAEADVGMVTSYCPDARAASTAVLLSRATVRAFYDLDTPATLARVEQGDEVEYLPPTGLGDFDLVFSYTGGPALDALRTRLGARRVAPLYGSVDPDVHHPAGPRAIFSADLAHLGAWAADEQPKLDRLLLEPARRRPGRRFLIGGSPYPASFEWLPNLHYVPHVPPQDHPAFFSSAAFTLNVTPDPMARLGWCPPARLFEAAACGAPILSDAWEGLEAFFQPGVELLLVSGPDDVLNALELGEEARRRIGEAARERVLACHTAMDRARDLEAALAGVVAGRTWTKGSGGSGGSGGSEGSEGSEGSGGSAVGDRAGTLVAVKR